MTSYIDIIISAEDIRNNGHETVNTNIVQENITRVYNRRVPVRRGNVGQNVKKKEKYTYSFSPQSV